MAAPRFVVTLGLALLLAGCYSAQSGVGGSATPGDPVSAAPAPGSVELLAGLEGCYAGGEHPEFQGVLVPDVEYGTRIEGKGPVMWPVGYTARRVAGGEVEVLDREGSVVATTGRAYMIAPIPVQPEAPQRLLERTGAIGSPDCYSWDLVDCSPRTTDPDADRYCPR